MPTVMLATLFDDPPPQWGFRGDPHLWRELGERFAPTPLPASQEELVALLHEAFEHLTGAPVSTEELAVIVSRYPKDGMSGGGVSPRFWRDTGIPLLCSRYRRVAGPQGSEGRDV